MPHILLYLDMHVLIYLQLDTLTNERPLISIDPTKPNKNITKSLATNILCIHHIALEIPFLNFKKSILGNTNYQPKYTSIAHK
jgi:tRNA nucleotidyltransferase (CCA-adding enzyme)